MTSKIEALLDADDESIGPGSPGVGGTSSVDVVVVVLVVGDGVGVSVICDIGVGVVDSLTCALGRESHANAGASVDCISSGILEKRTMCHYCCIYPNMYNI